MPTTRPPRIEFINPLKLGELLIKWAREPDTRPKTLADFKTATAAFMKLPDHFKALQFTQSNREVLYIRLPDGDDLEELLNRIGDSEDDYPLPDFYATYVKTGQPKKVREMFQMRMADFALGDYSIAECM